MSAHRDRVVVVSALAVVLTAACTTAGAPGAAAPSLSYPGAPAARARLGLQPGGLVPFQFEVAASSDAIWVLRPGELLRIDPDQGTVAASIPLDWRRLPSFTERPFVLGKTLAPSGDGGVWIAGWEKRTLLRVDTRTNWIAAHLELPDTPIALAAGENAVWVASQADRSLALILRRIDPESLTTLASISLPGTEVAEGYEAVALDLTVGPDAVWVAARRWGGKKAGEGQLHRINLASNMITASIPVEHGPSQVAVQRGNVWVTSAPGRLGERPALLQVDPSTSRVSVALSMPRPRMFEDPKLIFLQLVAADQTHLWILRADLELWGTTKSTRRLQRFDADRKVVVTEIDLGAAEHARGEDVAAVAIGGDAIWLLRTTHADPGSPRDVHLEKVRVSAVR